MYGEITFYILTLKRLKIIKIKINLYCCNLNYYKGKSCFNVSMEIASFKVCSPILSLQRAER